MEGKRVAEAESSQSGGHKILWVMLALVTTVSLCAVGFGVYANTMYDGVFPGVSVSGLSLEGESLQETIRELDSTLNGRLSSSVVTITAAGELLGSYDRATLGAHAETEETARAVYAIGREEGFTGWLKNALTMAKGLLGGTTEFEPVVTYDKEKLSRVIDEIAQQFDVAPQAASYELTPDGIFVTKECTGRTLDRTALAAALCGTETAVEATGTKARGESVDLEALAEELSAEPLPARYDHEQGRVVDGQVGVAIDVEAAQYVLDAAAEGERVQLPAEVKYPSMTAEELEAVLFRDLLSTASTKVSGTSARKGNVRLSAEFCNGVILNPNEEFDFNAVVGKRTVERGFGAAAAYVNGATVDEVGGGICQTSSTIYYASLLANLEITERKCHRYVSGYIEKGMDATVSWGGPEFRFRNDTEYPIKIETVYQNSTLTVNIYGTKTDDTYVKMSHKVISTTPYNVVRQETNDLPYGTEQRKQSGYTGYVVETYRSLYDGAGNLISTTFEDKSVYRSRDEIILVGMAGKPADTPADSTATISPSGDGEPSGGTTDTPPSHGGETSGETTDIPPSNGGETTDNTPPSGGDTTSGETPDTTPPTDNEEPNLSGEDEPSLPPEDDGAVG